MRVNPVLCLLTMLSFFSFTSTKATEKSPTKNTELSILSLNVHVFPKLHGVFSKGLKTNSKRIGKLAQTLLALPSLPDVVAVQEMWSPIYEKKFFKKIKHKYPYRYFDKKFCPLGKLGSGLAIYSQWPMDKAYYTKFRHYRGDENFARKGVLGVRLQKNNQSIYVFTTHLQAGGGGKFIRWWDKIHGRTLSTREIAYRQMKQAYKLIQEKVGSIQENVVLFTGDFNIRYNTNESEYTKYLIPALHNPHNTFSFEHSPNPGTVWHKNGTVTPKVIDYIFSLGKPIEGHSISISNFNSRIVDHLGIFGSFKI